ncbi:MAG: anti-sigma factor family protein [Gemmataceae bacterium]
MIHHNGESESIHPRELLGGYADGELESADQARVVAWLAAHPEVGQEVAALRRLTQVCRVSAPPMPSEATWQAVLGGVESALAPPAATPAVLPLPRRSRRRWLIGGVMTAAAAAVIAFILQQPAPQSPAPPSTNEMAAWQPLPVVSASDVTIISMHDADVDVLVIGAPPGPVEEPLALASASDINLERVEPDWDGSVAEIHWTEGPYHPMVLAPLPDALPRK